MTTKEQFASRAVGKVGNAIKSGKLIREKYRDCGAEKVFAHHPSYSKPLDVIWLCVIHHMLEHKRMRVAVAEEKLESAKRVLREALNKENSHECNWTPEHSKKQCPEVDFIKQQK